MDSVKIGKLIARLRKEKGLTQKKLAEALNISNKTVSKWECGLGCPDVSFWPELATILNCDVRQLIAGEMSVNPSDIGKLTRINFYVCPTCQNTLFSTSPGSIFCCGRKLEPLSFKKEEKNSLEIKTEVVDGDYFVTIDHVMERDHYLLFAAYVKDSKIHFQRLYPQQDPTVRLPFELGGKLYLYCTQQGLTCHKISLA